MVPWVREGKSLLGTDIVVALRFLFHSVVQGCFVWLIFQNVFNSTDSSGSKEKNSSLFGPQYS